MLAHKRASSSELMAFSLVKMVRPDDRANCFGDEIADALPFCNPLAHFGRRNIETPHHAEEVVRRSTRVALKHHELREPLQFRPTTPFREVAHIILPDEIKQLIARRACLPCFDSVHGETRPRTMDLGIVALKPALVFDGGPHHR